MLNLNIYLFDGKISEEPKKNSNCHTNEDPI